MSLHRPTYRQTSRTEVWEEPDDETQTRDDNFEPDDEPRDFEIDDYTRDAA